MNMDGGADVGKEFHDQYVYRHANGYVTCGCISVDVTGCREGYWVK